MSSSTLRLRKIINDPACLDMSREWIALDEQPQPPILVYGETLANAILRSEGFATYNIYAYWKVVIQAPPPEFPALETFFEVAPLFLHGESHRNARKALVPPYRRLESGLDQWLPAFAEKFFESQPKDLPVKPNQLAANYIEGVFREMLAKDVGCPTDDLPLLPSELFYFLPRMKHMQEYDSQLGVLVDAMKRHLSKSGKDPEEAWALASVAVAGQQPLTSALVYGLMNTPPTGDRWDSETLMRLSAPVSLLGREAREDAVIGDLEITSGQPLHICPFLVHQRADNHSGNSTARKSIAFGDGPHTCAGRRISLKITDAFFHNWAFANNALLDTSGIRLIRDFVLLPLEKK